MRRDGEYMELTSDWFTRSVYLHIAMAEQEQCSSESESMRESEDETTEEVGPNKKKQKLTRKYYGSALNIVFMRKSLYFCDSIIEF